MDDLAGSAAPLLQILVLGDWGRAEMAPVKMWVQSLGASACVQHQQDEAEEPDSASPDMVVVCQSWPDEFSAAEVATYLGRWPLALWVCCFGSWCESDGRTRTIWPIGVRVPARAAVTRLNRLWAIVTGHLQKPLPVTASRDEAFEFDAAFLEPAQDQLRRPGTLARRTRNDGQECPVYTKAELLLDEVGGEPGSDAIDISGAVISVRSPDPALKAWLSDLAIALGATLSDNIPDASAESRLVLWDVDPDCQQVVSEIKEFIAQHADVRVIAVAGLPHPEVKLSLQAVGVEAVITKAYATSQLAK